MDDVRFEILRGFMGDVRDVLEFRARTIQLKSTSEKHGWNDAGGFEDIAEEKLHAVESVLGESVYPTYSVFRRYTGQCGLPVHVDRYACDISIASNVYKTTNWPLFFSVRGEIREVHLEPGDAVLYTGLTVPHWRKPRDLGYDHISQLFMHYVRCSHRHAHVLKHDGADVNLPVDYMEWCREEKASLFGDRYDKEVKQIAESHGLEFHVGH